MEYFRQTSDFSLSGSECSSSSSSDNVPHEIQPFMFEPEYAENETSEEIATETVDINVLNNTDWCECQVCTAMPKPEECVCCKAYPQIIEKLDQFSEIKCITQHPGFTSVCLDEWVLEMSYFGYRQHHGIQLYDGITTVHEKYRYTAYRNFVRCVWKWLGERHRKIIPSCVVTTIRNKYSSELYTGFLPVLHD